METSQLLNKFNWFKKDNKPTANNVDDLTTKNNVIEIQPDILEYINVNKDNADIHKGKTHTRIVFSSSNKFMESKNAVVMRNKFSTRTNRVTLGSDYDFARIERIYEKEGIIRSYVVTATAKIMRAGFNFIPNRLFTGNNRDKWVKDINDRLQLILSNSHLSWHTLVQTTAKELVQNGNSIINKIRNPNTKDIVKLVLDDIVFYTGVVDPKTFEVTKYIRNYNIRTKPHSEELVNGIRSHYNLFSSVMQTDLLVRDMMSRLGYYKFNNKKSEQTIPPSNIIHFKYLIEKNALMAMPPIMASVIDIEDMHTLEENLIMLAWQYGHPILQIIVNTEGLTEPEAQVEINRAIDAVEAMDSTGFLGTTDRVKVELHYPSGQSIPIDKFVLYMQQRVLTGLDTSALLLGSGGDAGRQAGEIIEAAAGDIMQMIANSIGVKLQDELLMDIYKSLGGTGNVCPVKIKIMEIDRNRKAAHLNQVINMANQSLIPPSRVLEEYGQEPLSKTEVKELKDYLKYKNYSKQQTANPQNQHGEQTPGTTQD